MADDPESVPPKRPRRRRKAASQAAPDTAAAGRADEASPVRADEVAAPDDASAPPDVTSPAPDDVPPAADDLLPDRPKAAPRDRTPLPTFVHAGPGGALPLEVDGARQTTLAERPDPGTTPMARQADPGWLAVLEDRSPDPEICPFLRAVDASDRMVAPVETPDPANRCTAMRDAAPQSLRQQELVCLASGHVNCPRYLRGAVVAPEKPEAVVRPGRSTSPAVLGSVLVLLLSASASVAFVMARGGLELAAAIPTRAPVASAAAVVPASPTPVPAVSTPMPTPAPTPVPTPSPSASPSPTPTPTATPTPAATPEPTARPTPRPAATSDRFALLRRCPDTPRCWIYRVRAGDNIYSIANYFGVSQDAIYSRNPFVRNGLRPGQDLRLPPPTR